MPEFEIDKAAILTPDLPGDRLRAGDVGTVVEQQEAAGAAEIGYSVEFFERTGPTVAEVTVPASSLRVPTAGDRPAVREFSHR